MKNIFVCALLLVITVQIKAQKVIVNEQDQFTKERRIETDYFKVYGNMKNALYSRIWSVADRNYISIGAYGYGSPVIGNNSKLLILTNTDSTIVCYSPEIQTGNLNGTFTFKYKISFDDLQYLAGCSIKAVRIVTQSRDIDIMVPEKSQAKFKKLFQVYTNSYTATN